MFQGEKGLLVATFLLGSGITASKIALNYGISANLYTFLRFVIAFAFLAIIYRKRLRIQKKEVWLAGLWIGIASALGFIFQTIGLGMTTVAKVGFLSAMYVVLTPLLESAIKHKRPQGNDIIGIFLSVCGLVLMSLNGALSINLGDLLALVSALFFSIGLILIGKYAVQYDVVVLSTINIGVSALVAGCFWLLGFAAESTIVMNTQIIISIAYVAIIATALAFVMQTEAQKKLSATKAAVILALEPVFGAILAYLILHEGLSSKEICGALLMMIGMLISILKNNKK